MDIKLAENIRTFRKQLSLTQEQLAEVLGVTVGAVYKWEARLSQPELAMIMAMADFFDTSVDVLLGYEMKDNRLQASVDRLKQYRHEKNPEGLTEAEKALKKYPNAFEIVYISATMYQLFGIEGKEKALLRRALELLEYSRFLLPQNTDPEVGESTGCCYGTPAEGICCIKVLGAGCKSCHEQYENAMTAVKAMGLGIEVEYITDMEKVMGYSVMSMPAIVVNEKVVSMGRVLKAADVGKLLHKLGY